MQLQMEMENLFLVYNGSFFLAFRISNFWVKDPSFLFALLFFFFYIHIP